MSTGDIKSATMPVENLQSRPSLRLLYGSCGESVEAMIFCTIVGAIIRYDCSNDNCKARLLHNLSYGTGALNGDTGVRLWLQLDASLNKSSRLRSLLLYLRTICLSACSLLPVSRNLEEVGERPTNQDPRRNCASFARCTRCTRCIDAFTSARNSAWIKRGLNVDRAWIKRTRLFDSLKSNAYCKSTPKLK